MTIHANARPWRLRGLCQDKTSCRSIEPEVLMDGAHTIERCEEVTDAVLTEVFQQCTATASIWKA